MNKLIYNGKDYDSQISASGGGLELNHSMVGETLSVDTLTVPLVSGDMPVKILAVDQDESDFFITTDREVFSIGEYPLEFVDNGAGLYYFGDMLIGKYYINELARSGKYDYAMRFYSAIKLLNDTYHFGGLYTGEFAGDVIDDIMGDLTHAIDDDVAEIQVYGYLPYAKRRSNLQMLLMAIGAAVKNAADGTLRITSLSDTVAGVFDESRVFIGGSIVDKNPVTAVQVTEHNFLASEEVVTLYDGATINTETLIFREPYHDLDITGGTITESGVNYCKFTGSGAVVITGKRYTHVTRVLTHGTPPTGSDSDVVRSVTNNTLVTPINAAEVAEKLYDYLSVAKSIKAEVVFGTERPGDVVSIIHPYTNQMVSACIKSMSIQMGFTELRAQSEFLIDYIPPGATVGFEHYALLTGTGEWTVPEGVTRIRAILVGPGQGGQGGQGGSAPADFGVYANGGTAGTAGQNGKIFEMNLSVTPAEGIGYAAPTGSAGGGGTFGIPASSGGAPASLGSSATNPDPTTFGSLSSDQGKSYPYGYSEPKSGIVCGMSALDGANGGAGKGVSDPASSVTFGGTTWVGGNNTAYALGGGAAVGANGNNATFDGHASRAGKGANASNGSNATRYGEAGSGGHGGGGGGAAASTRYLDSGGGGGDGGDGGSGGPGCIIIYY